MNLKIISFKDNSPKRGKIICFSQSDVAADFFLLDRQGYAWICVGDEWECACVGAELQKYGHYSHWARIQSVFDIKFDIPKDE